MANLSGHKNMGKHDPPRHKWRAIPVFTCKLVWKSDFTINMDIRTYYTVRIYIYISIQYVLHIYIIAIQYTSYTWDLIHFEALLPPELDEYDWGYVNPANIVGSLIVFSTF